jgi:hypothetical protein
MATKPADAIQDGPNQWYVVRNGEPVGLCRDCWEPRPGASWNGRCLSCHEASLLPIGPDGVEETSESWADVYLGRGQLD